MVITFIEISQVPPQLLSTIQKLTKHGATIASLHGTNESVITEINKYRNGIFQGDTLSVLLVVLCLNPLSFLLQKLEGYSYHKSRNHTLTHKFFVDNIKLYASSISILKRQLDLVTTFLNHLTIKPIQEGESYQYLGQD